MASCLFDYNLSNQGPAQSTNTTGTAVASTGLDGEDAARPTPSIVARSRNNGIHDGGHSIKTAPPPFKPGTKQQLSCINRYS